MVKQTPSYFEAMLGINSPWSIQDLNIDEKHKIIKIDLAYQTEKPKFSFFSKQPEPSNQHIQPSEQVKRWAHIRLGHYSCHIHSSYVDTNIASQGIDRNCLLKPGFLGEVNRGYTHQLRQQIALAQARGLSVDAITQLFSVEKNLVEEILSDIEKTPDSYRLALLLPTEADPIWENIINDKFQLKTQSFPLRLLLSKLKLNIIDPKSTADISDAVAELRKFFIAQINHLDAEVSQLCAITFKKSLADENRGAVTRLVLPALKNSIWIKLVSGKVNLKSTNVPLNLFLVRLRHAFTHMEDNAQRINALTSLREFFRKNARTLKKELILINQLMNAPDENQLSLPDEHSEIWQRILRDDDFIPSSHIAYKLLLANLRSQVLMNPDPVIELNAARRIRDFIKHNQRFMQQELRMVLTNSRAHS